MTSPIETALLDALIKFRPDHVTVTVYDDQIAIVESEVVIEPDGFTTSPFDIRSDDFDIHQMDHGEIHCASGQVRYGVNLHKQAKLRGYKIDLLLSVGFSNWLAVECDGHDYHNATKQQIAYDRARDREFQLAGLPIFRFTGSEIYHSAERCARECYAMLESQFSREQASARNVSALVDDHVKSERRAAATRSACDVVEVD